jgi:hypothetical protein
MRRTVFVAIVPAGWSQPPALRTGMRAALQGKPPDGRAFDWPVGKEDR